MSLDLKWNFDNSYLQLPSVFYSKVKNRVVLNPSLVLYNYKLGSQLGLSELESEKEYLSEVLAGNTVPANAAFIAQAYAGHQFGHFNILGDGRAVLLGEVLNEQDERFDIQLKGAGATAYSRRGDGSATLYSMLREYLISEAMHGLRVRTTRSLAVVQSPDPVYRQEIHKTGILTRVAESHIRVGTFELAARMGNPQYINDLFKYTVNRHYPECLETANPALSFLKEVINAQVIVVNDWLKYGFIHGVMNTDNMSICGETIDYGPCAFMNNYDLRTVFSSIDTQGRYAFGNQSKIAKWNLMRFAETILGLIDDVPEKALELARGVFDEFDHQFQQIWKVNHLAKLGIIKEEDDDENLLNELIDWMTDEKPDFTNTFRGLVDPHLHADRVFEQEKFKDWKVKWQKRISAVDNYENILEDHNPSVIPRNHAVEEALISASEHNDMTAFNSLLGKLQKPFDKYEDFNLQHAPENNESYQTYCGT